jgi:hypothetical protein
MSDVSTDMILNAILELKGDVGGLVTLVKSQGDSLASHAGAISKINTTLSEKRGATRLAHALYVGVGTLAGGLAGFLGRHHG